MIEWRSAACARSGLFWQMKISRMVAYYCRRPIDGRPSISRAHLYAKVRHTCSSRLFHALSSSGVQRGLQWACWVNNNERATCQTFDEWCFHSLCMSTLAQFGRAKQSGGGRRVRSAFERLSSTRKPFEGRHSVDSAASIRSYEHIRLIYRLRTVICREPYAILYTANAFAAMRRRTLEEHTRSA